MKSFTEELVFFHQFLFEDEMSSIADNLDKVSINYIDTVIQEIHDLLIRTDNLENNLLDLPMKNKFELIILIYNKSDDIILYPKDLRNKYIEQWSANIGLKENVLRRCLAYGLDKIEEIINRNAK